MRLPAFRLSLFILFVIASEAKQSSAAVKLLDCFVASLLAMTGAFAMAWQNSGAKASREHIVLSYRRARSDSRRAMALARVT
jgi:hypothetical protein